MFVEALYGYWSNSLGLISDAIHMCFDCTALAIGLYASYISRQAPDSDHPYGYSRYEILSGFVNSIFLIFVGIKIFIESIERIMEIPEIQTDMLILVSILGLLVNIIGLCSFHDLSHGDNNNLRGVFLHVLADTLGSVGVIISTLLIKHFGWHIADPITSLIISLMILFSVSELLGSTIRVLIESDIDNKAKKITAKLKEIPGVDSVNQINCWKISGKQEAVMVSVKVKDDFNRKDLIKDCKALMPYWNSVELI
jgi:solute carrier family 30 (zinc transporter), member 5/7